MQGRASTCQNLASLQEPCIDCRTPNCQGIPHGAAEGRYQKEPRSGPFGQESIPSTTARHTTDRRIAGTRRWHPHQPRSGYSEGGCGRNSPEHSGYHGCPSKGIDAHTSSNGYRTISGGMGVKHHGARTTSLARCVEPHTLGQYISQGRY